MKSEQPLTPSPIHQHTRRDFLRTGLYASAGLGALLAARPLLGREESQTIIDQLQAKAPASWIWTRRDETAQDQMGQFRLEFDWNGRGEVNFLGFADSLYTIWCNGQPLGVGPILGVAEYPRLSYWDLSQTARRGRNLLAIQVWSYGPARDITHQTPLEGGLIGWVSSGDAVVATGPSWKARHAAGFQHPYVGGHRRFTESNLLLVDFRQEPLNWMSPNFDDSSWEAARVTHGFDHPQREGLRISPIENLTCTPLEPTILDAGHARGGTPVEFIRDVAVRMSEQDHESLLRAWIELEYPFRKNDRKARSEPDPSRLGWESLRCPVACPAPPAGAEFYLTLDIGRQSSGCILLEVDSPQERRIDIGYGDQLLRGRIQPTLQHSLADRILLPAGRSSVRVPHDVGCRFLQLTLDGPATIEKVVWEEHLYPHPDSLPFSSSDRALAAIWAAADLTLRQTSLTFYVDNSRRERQAWNGTELINSARGGFALLGDLALTKKQLEDSLEDAERFEGRLVPARALGNSPKSWVRAFDGHDLCFPLTCWEYVLRSDDHAFAADLTSASRRIVDHHGERLPNGLKPRIGAWAWNEWNLNVASQVVTAHNLLLIESLQAMESLYSYIGDTSQAQAMRSEADRLSQAIWQNLVDDESGVLCQGLDRNGQRVPYRAQFDNALALYLRLVPPDRQRHVYDFCSGPSGTWPTNRSGFQGGGTGEEARFRPNQMIVAGTPHGSLVAARTIAAYDSPQAALDYLRFNFGAMIDEGFGTLWEVWPFWRERENSTSASQGWGAAVAWYFLEFGLGVEIARPGATGLVWKPRRVNVEQLSGAIRSQRGYLQLGWKGHELHWDIPPGVTVELRATDEPAREIVGPSRRLRA